MRSTPTRPRRRVRAVSRTSGARATAVVRAQAARPAASGAACVEQRSAQQADADHPGERMAHLAQDCGEGAVDAVQVVCLRSRVRDRPRIPCRCVCSSSTAAVRRSSFVPSTATSCCDRARWRPRNRRPPPVVSSRRSTALFLGRSTRWVIASFTAASIRSRPCGWTPGRSTNCAPSRPGRRCTSGPVWTWCAPFNRPGPQLPRSVFSTPPFTAPCRGMRPTTRCPPNSSPRTAFAATDFTVSPTRHSPQATRRRAVARSPELGSSLCNSVAGARRRRFATAVRSTPRWD